MLPWRKATPEPLDDYWPEIGELAEDRPDHYAHQFPDGTSPAELSEYVEWVAGWIKATGQRPKRYYNYEWHDGRARIAYQDFKVDNLCGARAYKVIALPGVKHTAPDGYGHCKVYEMGTYKMFGGGGVAVYADLAFLALGPWVQTGLDAALRKSEEIERQYAERARRSARETSRKADEEFDRRLAERMARYADEYPRPRIR